MNVHGKLVALTLASALVGAACATDDAVGSPDRDASPVAVASPTPSGPDAVDVVDAIVFRQAMRELWNEHGNLTVRAIVAAVGGLDETGPVVAELQANQDRIGDAIKPLYGDEAGDALAELLHEHIDTAVATLTAAIGGDQSELEPAAAAFYANGDEIAEFLAAANPDNWDVETMKAMMTMHLDQVVELATAQIGGEHEQALAVYADYIHHLNIGMADMLSDGIIAQFPNQFSAEPAGPSDELRQAMRELWNEHGNLTVRAIVAAVGGLDETGPVVAELQANQDRIGDAIKPLYGDEAGDALAELLHEHIDTAVATLTAAIGGDQSELEPAAAAFYANGDEIAEFLAAANPDNWDVETMKAMMTMHLDQVVELATAQIGGEHEQALAVYADYIHHLNIGMADMLSDGIIAQFPDQF